MFTQSELNGFSQLMRIEKPIGTLLLLWPTYWALWLAADGMPDWPVLIVFTLGVFLMRSAGCVINDYADRKVDGHVERTSQRPLATGVVTSKQALQLFFILLTIAFLLVLTMNSLTIGLSFVAVALAATYPFMKRYTHLPQVVLGAAFGWSIPMAFAAQSNDLPTICWWLFAANLAWTVAYDTYYAMVDREDDIKIGVKSTAILFGRYDLVAIALLQLITVLCLLKVASLAALTWPFYLAMTLCIGLFIHQYQQAKTRERDKCFQAFIQNNRIGTVLFIGIIAHYLLLA
ncbi:4-hydroxybenzoate octaprenyltransferase [Psychrobium sp. 1_MG-2023]|uniref:4-hydroxybenzoate octaprenyltransferase n=1 Tax=Psychrobium sp. 1_MG-2023 TaxID=3062624 RepID=UPI000C3393B7|nr:4-hydroxybenzoate octaprenyltransferase [Psychrobium sp. 1_MG-2023]MDP2559561.1 4-hydroxybenzoate octaprenyltransferase [Psychrobium sp. 1_MG-2023]PKF59400.1 4-hydroxybenzoate octaprenyltransferase [Alteromonadales bacterium alter-6D02]